MAQGRAEGVGPGPGGNPAGDGPRDPAGGAAIAVSDEGLPRVPESDAASHDAVVRAALACHDEADFLARLRRRR